MISNLNITHSLVEDGNLSYVHDVEKTVRDQRETFLSKNKLTLDDCVAARLTHSTDIVDVTAKDKGKGMYDFDSGVKGDAMITRDNNIALFMLTADCLPVVLYDPTNYVVALAHLSTNNTTENFLDKIITRLTTHYHTSPKDLQAYLGPCIHHTSYTKLKSDFPSDMLKNWDAHSHKIGTDKVAFDLPGRNYQELIDMGVAKDNIIVSSVDTYTSPEYFSHRLSADNSEPEGRFATIVRIK